MGLCNVKVVSIFPARNCRKIPQIGSDPESCDIRLSQYTQAKRE